MKNQVKEALTAYDIVKTTLKRNTVLSNLDKITCAQDADDILRCFYHPETLELKEYFYTLYLNRANKPIAVKLIGEGSLVSTVVDVPLIIKTALDCRASGLILSHNHPSGQLEPSAADKDLTAKIKEAAKFFDIQVMDHIILTAYDYYSFADNGTL